MNQVRLPELIFVKALDSRSPRKDSIKDKKSIENCGKAIVALSDSLPGMVRSQIDQKVSEDLEKVVLELDRLKDLFNGLEKTNIDLLKWRNTGLICHRDELVGSRWANAVLELTNSDNSASFERLVAVCIWAKSAFYSAPRQDNVRRFLGKFHLK